MQVRFKESVDDLEYVYYDQLPDYNESKYHVNLSLLQLYGLYRNSIFDSYSQKADLAADIKSRSKTYLEPKESKCAEDALYQSSVYHYSVSASLDAMKEWQTSKGDMKCYIAYQHVDGQRIKVGFVHFIKQRVNNNDVVYIAQAGVTKRGCSIGRHLMECVLAHYPAETQFYILTRIFNTDAKNLYEKRLLFSPIGNNEIQQLGFDNRYCGYQHKTSQQEVDEIKNRQIQNELKKNYQRSQ